MKKTSRQILFALAACACLAPNIRSNAASMAIDSLTGQITANEISAFKTYMAAQTPGQTPWGTLGGTGHNEWSDGNSGNALEAIGLMYEATGDINILNSMISWADKCTSERNDLMSSANGGQRVMWTGHIDKVWCPNDPTSANAKYAGSENEDTEAHLAYCALEILHNPSIWSLTVPDGNPFGYGTTYFQRATNYVTKCDQGNQEYSLVYFIQSGTSLIRPPTSSAWTVLNENVTSNNRQMMFDGGFQRLAEAHAILGDNATLQAQYNAIVNASANECINGMKIGSVVSGDTVYKWGYYPTNLSPNESFNESVGHGAYDAVGIYRAYNNGSYGISLSSVTPFANAVVDVMNVSANDFSDNVDGSGGTQNYMQAQWLLLADWNPSVYDVIAAADLATGRYKTTTLMDATILWMKQRRFFSSGIWELQNLTSSQALNQGGSTTNGSPISQWNWVGSVNEEFKFIPTTYGYYQINSVKSGKDVVVAGASTANGANLVQWSFGSSGDDQWQPVQNTNATWYFYNLHSGKALNNTGGSLTQGTQYSQWTWLNSQNEEFNLIQR